MDLEKCYVITRDGNPIRVYGEKLSNKEQERWEADGCVIHEVSYGHVFGETCWCGAYHGWGIEL